MSLLLLSYRLFPVPHSLLLLYPLAAMDESLTPSSPIPIREERPDPFVGKEFLDGQFRVLSKLASGGMGAIYLAEQPALKRRVAVKILHPELARRPDLIIRFHREAKATSQLTHPNTIRTYLYGELPDKTIYIVMEYLDGANLLQTIRKEGPLELSRAVGIIAQIAAALDEAHEAGIIHRDLKSENIFLATLGGATDVPKILDFGIATLRQNDETSAALTAAGMVFGTPQYMSPEQARGHSLDGRSDLYSLGVIFYEAVSGLLPWDAKTPMDYMTKHLSDLPEPIAKRNPAVKVPQEIEAVISRLLRKEKGERYRSGAELGRALVAAWKKAAAKGQVENKLPAPLTAPVFAGEPPAELTADAPRRRPWLGVALVVLGLAGAGVAYWVQSPTQAAQDATLTIVASPPNAKIFLNGDLIEGQSPYTLRDLPPGTYEVKGEAELFEPGRSRIVLTPGMLGAVDVRLTAIPPQTASLFVEVVPADAEITLDNKIKKIGTLTRSDLQPGVHTVSLSAKGYLPYEATLELSSERDKSQRFWMIPESYALHVASKPKGAEIRVFESESLQDKGKSVGRTNTVIKGLSGKKEYRVELSLKGYQSSTHNIRLDPTKDLAPQQSLSIELKEASPDDAPIKIIQEGESSQGRGKALAGGRDLLGILDRNRSGGVSQSELSLFPGLDLKAADLDKDGELSAEEIANYGPKAWGLSGTLSAASVTRLLKLGIAKFSDDLARCSESAARVLVDFVITADGRVVGASPRSLGFAGTKDGDCVEKILKKIRFVPPGQKLEIAFDVEIEAVRE